MSQTYDIVIVSCGGRGQWMASRFSELNCKVAFIDLSSRLGRWAPEDWEGPFGYFHSSSFSPSQVERLSEDEYLDPIEEGFSLWLKDGPLDFRGPLSGFRLKELQESETLSGYLNSYHQQEAHINKKTRNKLSHMEFSQNWIFNLSHQLSSTVFKENVTALEFGRPLPLSSNYSIRRSSRLGHEKSLNWCEQKGVKVFKEAQIEDMLFEGSKCTAIEIKSSWSGAISGTHFYWLLSSEETQYCSPKVAKALFPKGVLQSQWSWVRFGIQLTPQGQESYLPKKFTIINDIHLPWTHLNLCMVQQTEQVGQYDVWLKIPSQQRFSKNYIEDIYEQLELLFQDKIPGIEVKLWQMPQDYLYTYEELGPSRFSQYDSDENKNWDTKKIENFNFLGPEKLSSWDWTGQLYDHRQVLDQFKSKEIYSD